MANDSSKKKDLKSPAPVAASPEPAPVAASPEPAPVAASPEPAPVAASPEPAPVAASPEPEPVDPLKELDKRIADLDLEIEKAAKAKDYKSLAQLGQNADQLRSQRIDIALNKSIEEFIPEMLKSIEGAPEGKYLVLVTFDGGRAISAVRRAMVETPAKAVLASTETKSRESATASVKANFTAGSSGDPNRHAPPGFKSSWSHAKHGTWNVLSLGAGNYRFTQGDKVLEGIGNAVIKSITGQGPNVYFELGLPGPSETFNPAQPPKGWTL